MAVPDVPSAALSLSGRAEPKDSAQSPEATLIDKIRAAATLDDLFLKLKEDLVDLFEVEQLTLYAIDRENRELYSRFLLDSLQGIQEIRVPIDATSVSGYCARYGKVLNIGDVYDADELAAIGPHLTFNRSWDERSGFRTRQMLAVPILVDGKYLMGALLLINKRNGERFTSEEETCAGTIAEAIGIAIRQHTTAARQQTASQFDHLLEQAIISPAELESAMAEARHRNCDTESVLLDTYQVPKADIGRALSLHYGCPFVAYDERTVVDSSLLRGLNLDYLRMNYWMPLRRSGDHVEVIVDNPKDAAKIEHIRALLPGASLRWRVALRQDLVRFLQRANSQQGEAGGIEDILGELHDSTPLPQDAEPAGGLREDDSVIVRLGNQIILDAHAQGASDIHIEPYAAQRDTVVRLRVDGHCREYQRIPPSYRRALVSRLKIMARLDIAERRKPQDGKIQFRLPTGRDIELRVATVPVASGDEDVVLRILTASEPLPLSALHMTPRNLERFEAAIRKPYGLVLAVGPTGSGKTTTLHAALGAINESSRKIWTAEDPVEITQYGLRQVQVQPRIGFTFATAMRSFLRADPDVIMVGEMRDAETAHIGIEASLTGHLVFSTLHTNSAPETVTRLLDIGIDPFNFADALVAVLARTLCPACKEAHQPDEAAWTALQQAYGKDAFAALDVAGPAGITLYRAKGCEVCQGLGYKGRVAVHELLVASDEVRHAIQSRALVTDIAALARQQGMTTLLQDGVLKVLNGLTDLTQVKAAAER
jgi:type II secretory ATPase GspE/PulE/Tfp pilus assembly ATPase PilB-like protein/GAF domain-containing protein